MGRELTLQRPALWPARLGQDIVDMVDIIVFALQVSNNGDAVQVAENRCLAHLLPTPRDLATSTPSSQRAPALVTSGQERRRLPWNGRCRDIIAVAMIFASAMQCGRGNICDASRKVIKHLQCTPFLIQACIWCQQTQMSRSGWPVVA